MEMDEGNYETEVKTHTYNWMVWIQTVWMVVEFKTPVTKFCNWKWNIVILMRWEWLLCISDNGNQIVERTHSVVIMILLSYRLRGTQTWGLCPVS